MPDHIHILIGMKPTCCLSDLIREAKKASVEYINSTFGLKNKFSWQAGFGAFSVGYMDRYVVINYIPEQKKHHRKFNFREEYMKLLIENEIEFKNEICLIG